MIVSKTLSTTPFSISFRRALDGDRLYQWLELVATMMHTNLNEQSDRFV